MSIVFLSNSILVIVKGDHIVSSQRADWKPKDMGCEACRIVIFYGYQRHLAVDIWRCNKYVSCGNTYCYRFLL